MSYILTPESGGLIQIHEFWKNEDVITIEYYYDTGYIRFEKKPKFIKSYDPSIGIYFEDIDDIDEYEHWGLITKKITYSDGISKKEQKKLSEIIEGTSKEYQGNYDDVLAQMEWEPSDECMQLVGNFKIEKD